jgi:hypothetical protein
VSSTSRDGRGGHSAGPSAGHKRGLCRRDLRAGTYPLARHLSTAPAAAGGAGGIVPRVAGDTLVSAERAVVRAGLSVGHLSRQHSDAVPLGRIQVEVRSAASPRMAPGTITRESPPPRAVAAWQTGHM